MPSLIWGLYFVLLLLALGYLAAVQVSSGMSSVSIPQMLFGMYILLAVFFFAATRNYTAIAAGLIVLSCLFLQVAVSPYDKWREKKKHLSRQLREYRAAIKSIEKNGPAMELIGDVYASLEDRDLALKYYKMAEKHMTRPPLFEKRSALEAVPPKFHLEGDPLSHVFKACPDCEAVALRKDFDCSKCGRAFYPDRRLWRMMRFNDYCDDFGVTQSAIAGILFFPFLFALGHRAYAVLLLLWCAALASEVKQT